MGQARSKIDTNLSAARPGDNQYARAREDDQHELFEVSEANHNNKSTMQSPSIQAKMAKLNQERRKYGGTRSMEDEHDAHANYRE